MKSILAALVLTFVGISPVNADWLQWRGPNRDGSIPAEGSPWPESLKEDRLVRSWRVDLDTGYPGPIVSGSRVFTAETRNRKEEVVRAFDRKSGKQLWETSWPGAMSVPFFAAANGSWIRSTPACDGESLYVAGMRDVLVCLDAASGKERWRFDFVKEMKSPLPPFGFVCSPLLDERHVYVQAGSCFAKLEKATGKVVWTTLKTETGGLTGSAYDSAFSSPIFAEIAGKKQVLVQTRSTLAGVDPESGKVLWEQKVPAFRNMNILTPTVSGDAVFTSTYGGKSFLYEVESLGKKNVKTSWTNRQEGYMSSPVVIDGHLYLHLRSRLFTCIDLKDGATKWTTSRRFGQYWSMIARGNRILALDEQGMLFLIRATPEKFDLLDERKISDQPTWGHLAISGDELFVRELRGLAAFRWK